MAMVLVVVHLLLQWPSLSPISPPAARSGELNAISLDRFDVIYVFSATMIRVFRSRKMLVYHSMVYVNEGLQPVKKCLVESQIEPSTCSYIRVVAIMGTVGFRWGFSWFCICWDFEVWGLVFFIWFFYNVIFD